MIKQNIQINHLRIFGYIWAAIFLFIGLANYASIINWSFLTATFFLITATVYPKIYIYTYIYQGWIKFGNLAGKANSYIIIVILFFFMFVPVGIILKDY